MSPMYFLAIQLAKGKAKKEVLSYFEEKYHEDFVVYSAKYNLLIPDYNIKLGPIDDTEITFETSRYELTMLDPYGAYLASKELKARILDILGKEIPKIQIYCSD